MYVYTGLLGYCLTRFTFMKILYIWLSLIPPDWFCQPWRCRQAIDILGDDHIWADSSSFHMYSHSYGERYILKAAISSCQFPNSWSHCCGTAWHHVGSCGKARTMRLQSCVSIWWWMQSPSPVLSITPSFIWSPPQGSQCVQPRSKDTVLLFWCPPFDQDSAQQLVPLWLSSHTAVVGECMHVSAPLHTICSCMLQYIHTYSYYICIYSLIIWCMLCISQ